MSTVTIMPKYFSMANNNNIDEITQTAEKYTVTSTINSSQYAKYQHPVSVPAQTTIKVTVQARYVSGAQPKLKLEFSNTIPYTGGGQTTGETKLLDDGDWHEINVVETSIYGTSNFRVILGYFGGENNGVFEFRNFKIEMSCGIESALPQTVEPLTYSKTFSAEELFNSSEIVATNGGTVTLSGGVISGNSPDTSGSAYLYAGALDNSTRTIYQPNATLVRVKVKAKKLSKYCGVAVRFSQAYGGSVGVSFERAMFTQTDDFENFECSIGVPDGTELIGVIIGCTGGEVGTFEIKSAKIEVYGSDISSKSTPIMAKLSVSSGVWSVDSGAGRFSLSGVIGISVSGGYINLSHKTPETRPIMVCNTQGYSTGSNYIAKIKEVFAGSSQIAIYATSAPTVEIDPATVADGTVIDVIGLSSI